MAKTNTEQDLEHNAQDAKGQAMHKPAYPGKQPINPAKHVAVVACMDARLDVEDLLGLQTGDAHIIRNAGGIVTEDALRSLLISHYLLGTSEFMIINHTDCGMLTFKDEDLRTNLELRMRTASVSPEQFHAFRDPDENVRRQIQKVRSHAWIPKEIPVRGFVYDVKTGRLKEVSAAAAAAGGA